MSSQRPAASNKYSHATASSHDSTQLAAGEGIIQSQGALPSEALSVPWHSEAPSEHYGSGLVAGNECDHEAIPKTKYHHRSIPVCLHKKAVHQVSTAAVVSWPAMSMVMRSSRSMVSLRSASRTSTRKRSRLGSRTYMGTMRNT